MTDDESRQFLERLQRDFGTQTLLNVFPQRQVKHVLQLRSIADLSIELCVPYETLRSRIATGQVPKPAMHLGRRGFFTAEQTKAIKQDWYG